MRCASTAALVLLGLVAGCAYQVPQPVVPFNADATSMQALGGFELRPAVDLRISLHDGARTLQLSFINNQDQEVQIESIRVRPDGANGECSLFMVNRINVPAETTANIPLVRIEEVEACAGRSSTLVDGRRLHSISGNFQGPSNQFSDMPVEIDLRSREVEDPGGWKWSTTETFHFWYPRA